MKLRLSSTCSHIHDRMSAEVVTTVLLAEGALQRKHRFCGYFSFCSYGRRTFIYTFVLKEGS